MAAAFSVVREHSGAFPSNRRATATFEG